MTITNTPENLTITLTGHLDTLAARQLETELQAVKIEPGQAVEADLTNLSYISSSGLRCLVLLYRAATDAGSTFTVTGVQPAVREVFDITGFSQIFSLT